jgi:hypothetical protein
MVVSVAKVAVVWASASRSVSMNEAEPARTIRPSSSTKSAISKRSRLRTRSGSQTLGVRRRE